MEHVILFGDLRCGASWGTDAPTPQGVPWPESLPWSQDLPDLSDLFFLGSQHFATLVSGLFVLLALTCIHVHPIFIHPPGHLIVFATDPSGILKITWRSMTFDASLHSGLWTWMVLLGSSTSRSSSGRWDAVMGILCASGGLRRALCWHNLPLILGCSVLCCAWGGNWRRVLYGFVSVCHILINISCSSGAWIWHLLFFWAMFYNSMFFCRMEALRINRRLRWRFDCMAAE